MQSKFSSTPHLGGDYRDSTHPRKNSEMEQLFPILAHDTQNSTYFSLGSHSAYLLLVGAVHWISPICCRCCCIHARVMRWHSISISIINLRSIVCTCPLVAVVTSKLQNPYVSSKNDKLEKERERGREYA